MNKIKTEKKGKKTLEELLNDLDEKIINEVKEEMKGFLNSPPVGKEII